MPENTLSLMYAIRFSVVCKYAAQLILVQAGLIFIPFCLALFYAEYELALRFFSMSCLLTLIALPFVRIPVPAHVQTNEALIITVIAFLVGAAAMVYPYIQRGIEEGTANSALIKLNQIGTVSETIDAVRLCRNGGWRYFISHRSGETEDSFLADFAVVMDGGHLKTGSASRGERIAKYNRSLEIEQELGKEARYYWYWPEKL